LIDETPVLRAGSFSNALEEYAEARIFLHFHETKQLLVPADLPQINTEEYLGGLLDFTGELNRWAVIQATSRRVDDVKYARDCVDAGAFCTTTTPTTTTTTTPTTTPTTTTDRRCHSGISHLTHRPFDSTPMQCSAS